MPWGDPLWVLIVDDEEADRLAVRRALAQLHRPMHVAEAGSGSEACQFARIRDFDLVILDYRLPDFDGFQLLRLLMEELPEAAIFVLTGHGDERLAVKALKEGAVDYLPKSSLATPELFEALVQVMRQREERSEEELVRRQLRERIDRLTRREQQIMQMLLKGRVNKAIAAELAISPRTVETHRARIMKKLQARSLAELVKMGLLAGEAAALGSERGREDADG